MHAVDIFKVTLQRTLVLLVAVLAVTFLSGCGDSDGNDQNEQNEKNEQDVNLDDEIQDNDAEQTQKSTPPYTLHFKGKNGEFNKKASVQVDEEPAGDIIEIQKKRGKTVATVEFNRKKLPDGALHKGIEATQTRNGGISISSKGVAADSPKIPPETTNPIQPPPYRLKFKAERGPFTKGAPVQIDGTTAGTITDVEKQNRDKVATVEFKSENLPRNALHKGIVAKQTKEGRIKISTDEVDENAPKIPPGTTISTQPATYLLKFKTKHGNFEKGDSVHIDGKEAGTVTDIQVQDDTIIVTVEFIREDLKHGTLHKGVEAKKSSKGGITIDTPSETSDAQKLAEGATLRLKPEGLTRADITLMVFLAIAALFVTFLYVLYMQGHFPPKFLIRFGNRVDNAIQRLWRKYA